VLPQFDGSEVPPDQATGLEVTVVSAEVEPAVSDDEFPRWGAFTPLTGITRGRPGGCK